MSLTPFRWNSTTLMSRIQDWLLKLEDFPEVLRQLPDVEVAEKAWKEKAWKDYKKLLTPDWMKAAESLIARTRELLFEDTGITILKCGTKMTDDQARLVELLVGCSLGENMTIAPGDTGRPLFQVTASEDKTAGGQYLGNGLKRNAIGSHTDASGTLDRKVEVLSMLYVRPARFGGQSRIANSQLAFEELKPETRAILGRHFPRQSPYKEQEIPSQLVCIPIFRKVGKNSVLEFSYHPTRIRNGLKLARATPQELETAAYDPDSISSKLSEDENRALGTLDDALDKASCEVSLGHNEILILNNQIVTHDRRPFWDDPRAPRLMERFWAGLSRPMEDRRHLVGQASCASCASDAGS